MTLTPANARLSGLMTDLRACCVGQRANSRQMAEDEHDHSRSIRTTSSVSPATRRALRSLSTTLATQSTLSSHWQAAAVPLEPL